MKVDTNDAGGVQVEWRNIILTLRPNSHHGIMGSVAEMTDDGKIRLLEFHGGSVKKLFPVRLHEQTLDAKKVARAQDIARSGRR